ncbi:MAG: guanylate kinase [Clostridia bacterium]|nr:guanylate kinase [Clostridia bacterium]
MSKGKLLILSGPSGVGKGKIVEKLMLRRPNTSLSVSCTTREPRKEETEGVSYYFITKEKFKEMIESGGFLEYSEHFGNFYGTPRKFVEDKLKEGDVILEIEVNGALNVKKAMPEAVLVMIEPPTREELYARLKGRGTESEEAIARRMDRYDYEISKRSYYDYEIINDNLETAVDEVEAILNKGDL